MYPPPGPTPAAYVLVEPRYDGLPGWGAQAGSGASPPPQRPQPAAVPAAVPGGTDLFILPPPLSEGDLRQHVAGPAGAQNPGLSARPPISTRAFRRVPAAPAPASRAFHKYLLKGLKDCSLRLSNHHANLRTTPCLLAPQNQRAGHPGASDLLVKALVSEKGHLRPRGQGQMTLRRPLAKWPLWHIHSTILNEKESKQRMHTSV